MPNDDRFLVSGWEDDFEDIDSSRNPEDVLQQKFLAAAESGDLDTVKALLQQQPDLINAIDKDKYTALHRACYGNHIEVVKFLLQHGANVAAKTELGWEPLHSCCQWNHKECAAILIQHGANVNARSEGGQTPLHIAASHGASYDTVQLLLMNPDVKADIKNNNGETAYDIAKRSSRFYNIFEAAEQMLDISNIEKFIIK